MASVFFFLADQLFSLIVIFLAWIGSKAAETCINGTLYTHIPISSRRLPTASRNRRDWPGWTTICSRKCSSPTEEVVELKRGRSVNTERKFFPGYVLVKMDMTDAAYHLVKNTPKVTGFLGQRIVQPQYRSRGGSDFKSSAGGRGASQAFRHIRGRRAGACFATAHSHPSTVLSKRLMRIGRG